MLGRVAVAAARRSAWCRGMGQQMRQQLRGVDDRLGQRRWAAENGAQNKDAPTSAETAEHAEATPAAASEGGGNKPPEEGAKVEVEAGAGEGSTKQETKKEVKEEEVGEKSEAEKKLILLKRHLEEAEEDHEGAKVIAKRDVDNARSYALGSIAKELLEVADNMERAAQSVTGADKENPHVVTTLSGIAITSQSLSKVLELNGILKMDVAPGVQFNPEYHDALFNVPWSEGKEPGTVGYVVKTGYTYRGRVLRAAQCGVVAEKDP
eukprot:Hpha_TRINITY_DN43_c0_g1::TRINITY_DN43_c0_g1_i1::g.110143::m.110143/K03687/GRPE; molecular chaperone GrpE